MHRQALMVLILIGVTLAGCLEENQDTQPNGAQTPPAGELPEPRKPGSLDAPMEWRVGDWWTYELSSQAYAGYEDTVTIVVAEVTPEYYVVGMPRESFDSLAYAGYFPPMGEIDRDDLSWLVLGKPLKLLDFPLHNGSYWETDFFDHRVEPQVTLRGNGTAFISIRAPGRILEATFDLAMSQFTEIDLVNYGDVKLINHGTNYHGEVTVPTDPFSFMVGRINGLHADGNPPVPVGVPAGPPRGIHPSPIDIVTVPDRQHLALTQWVGSYYTLGINSPGTYQETAQTPDGTQFAVTRAPHDGAGTYWQHLDFEQPGGDWTFTHVALGFGMAASRGIAYDLKEYTLD